MALPEITVTGRLVADPEMRFSQSGVGVLSVRLAANSRRKNPQTQEWEDGDTWFGRAVAFGRTAEAIADSGLSKGDLVTVKGRIKTDQWQDKESGAKRSADQVVIDEIARPVRAAKPGGGQSSPAPGSGYGQQGGFGAPAADPWSARPASVGAQADEPPF
ncbi:single-stranded DNA-binding protein [Marinitenerispora sediminis]|uniref:Single-stranded DNA-binding protein n=1 Tax=Marinitenerispora sediminis TaxID=1931232 RepID=A0A368T6L7_9ACTN|nr:single-stranded DNA-binding protein [Marinitenerispora sediminis]RCV53488.1 single-stranded DNA-binding protein [Marinitenerispora sediminis]RCV59316.1 single-stranded DNA-binding protein [Marinitenerispora sediminis]